MSVGPGYKPDQIIKDAAKHGELVVFVGAGASMLCGSPDWRGFANAVVAQLEKAGALTFLQPELDVRDPSTLDLQNHLDRCVADSTAGRRQSALRLVDRNPGLAAYFLNSLNDPVWFEDLVHKGFFEPKDNPALKEVETAQGKAYQAEGWPALRYLERIASRMSGDQGAMVINIVRTINADSVLRSLNNWRTSWSLATIVSQLPTELLTSTDFQMMRGWLLGPFDGSMVGAELGRRLLPRLLQSDMPGNEEKALMLVDVLTTLKLKESS